MMRGPKTIKTHHLSFLKKRGAHRQFHDTAPPPIERALKMDLVTILSPYDSVAMTSSTLYQK